MIKRSGRGKRWAPLDSKDMLPEELAKRLKRWRENPSLEPDLEKWYQTGWKYGIPFTERKPEQREIDFQKYYPKYEQARALEKDNKSEEALATTSLPPGAKIRKTCCHTSSSSARNAS
ncbi:MAG: hypothetical protein M1379_00235 [Firmicutes bacterium]|nr:hypothetical protein [Bacillota bacterium]